MGSDTSTLLRQIDDHTGNCDKLIDELFKRLDKDNSGFIEGQEYDTFLDEVTEYMLKDFKNLGHTHDKITLRRWAKEWLDPNRDGKISHKELKTNIKRVLDAGESGL